VYDAGMIHRATCPQFDRGLDVDWTNTAKACGLTQFVVDRWAEQKYGSYPERWTSTW
jgi:metal-sulfur cluster biosynthetic enzyme